MLCFDWQRKAFKSRGLAGMLVNQKRRRSKKEGRLDNPWYQWNAVLVMSTIIHGLVKGGAFYACYLSEMHLFDRQLIVLQSEGTMAAKIKRVSFNISLSASQI